MCLAIPAEILEIDGQQALASFAGVKRRVGLHLVPQAQVGDYVLVHTGFAISILDEEDAMETLRLLSEIAALGEEGSEGEVR